MKPTIDFRRRKTPFTLTDVLEAQRRRYQKTGRRDQRLVLRKDQEEHFFDLIVNQVAVGSEPPKPGTKVAWNSVEVVIR